ncbi:MAG: plastocyanin/azurin family copper-binding protein [Chthoniobacterales bacterium]
MITRIQRRTAAIFATLAALFVAAHLRAATVAVTLEEDPNYYYVTVAFSPSSVTINVGDTVQWQWNSGPHSVTSGTPDHPSGLFDSGIQNSGHSFSHTFTDPGQVPYYCMVHGSMMTGVVKVVAPSVTPALLNLSTRLRVQTGENVLIGGFIVNGSAPKRIAIRGLGPSLTANGQPIAGTLPNPFLELHDQAGAIVSSNDDWQTGPDKQELTDKGLAPASSLESALIASVNPGNYTAILHDAHGASGIGLVELFDIDQAAASAAVNISTRGFVETGDNVMIGGFIIGGSASQRVLIRAIGPSLASSSVTNALQNPMLELHDANGALTNANDDWKSTQPEITATGAAPSDDRESAIVATLPPAGYTAIVRGANSSVGVALVEAYQLSN